MCPQLTPRNSQPELTREIVTALFIDNDPVVHKLLALVLRREPRFRLKASQNLGGFITKL